MAHREYRRGRAGRLAGEGPVLRFA